jgi:hypothetical protein
VVFGKRDALSVPELMLLALVASVLQELAALLRSPQAGWLALGTPLVEMELIHWCVVCASDSTPPRVETVGVGSRPAGRVPELMLLAFVASVLHDAAALLRSPQAGWLALGTPLVEMELTHWCAVWARDSTPPKVEAVGAGRRAAGNVPELMLLAFVASVLHDAAALLRSPQDG